MIFQGLRRCLVRSLRSTAKSGLIALEVYLELLPGIRMTVMSAPTRRLPKNLGAGLLGAEAATWWAISPSLLPRPWWVTAANVACCQAVGHAAATGLAFGIRHSARVGDLHLPARLRRRTNRITHVAMAGITSVVFLTSLYRQDRQAALVSAPAGRGRRAAVRGSLVGTLGYGLLLLLAEASQSSVDRLNRELRRWLPPVVSWPLATLAFVGLITLASDRVLVRRFFNRAARSARRLNEAVVPEAAQPTEFERTGSAHSHERWHLVGSQGRALLSSGPRARDIAEVTGLSDASEPIRVFIGYVEGRTLDEAAELAIAELERTGAFERSAIVMMTSAGTGWLSDFSVDAVEFLTGGDCALVAMQYSYLPSAVSYLSDRDSPIESSMLLIQAIEERLARLDDDARPKFFVSGESLGGYGIAESFDHIADLLARCDGAVFSGVPGFTGMHRALTVHRDAGSPHRLPLVDGGRHVRFVATPEHLDHDFRGEDYPEPWATPRVVFAQHASDPIVYWHPRIFYRRPEWLSEPGSRGVPAPAAQHLDVFEGMRWVPFITGWQVGLDQLTSLDVPGGHGHNYHREMLSYWAAVLDDVVAFEVTEEFLDAAEAWIYDDHIDR